MLEMSLENEHDILFTYLLNAGQPINSLIYITSEIQAQKRFFFFCVDIRWVFKSSQHDEIASVHRQAERNHEKQ